MPDCRDCKYWSYDMDMDAFCVHPNASIMGTYLCTMRGEDRTPNMRGEPCGRDGRFFEGVSKTNSL